MRNIKLREKGKNEFLKKLNVTREKIKLLK